MTPRACEFTACAARFCSSAYHGPRLRVRSHLQPARVHHQLVRMISASGCPYPSVVLVTLKDFVTLPPLHTHTTAGLPSGAFVSLENSATLPDPCPKTVTTAEIKYWPASFSVIFPGVP